MQVFILGMHRSGTSALARVLNLMGLYFGGENVGTGRSAENIKGFWERRDVRDLNDAILATAGCDWDVVSALRLDTVAADTRAGYALAAANTVLNLGRPPALVHQRTAPLPTVPHLATGA